MHTRFHPKNWRFHINPLWCNHITHNLLLGSFSDFSNSNICIYIEESNITHTLLLGSFSDFSNSNICIYIEVSKILAGGPTISKSNFHLPSPPALTNLIIKKHKNMTRKPNRIELPGFTTEKIICNNHQTK